MTTSRYELEKSPSKLDYSAFSFCPLVDLPRHWRIRFVYRDLKDELSRVSLDSPEQGPIELLLGYEKLVVPLRWPDEGISES